MLTNRFKKGAFAFIFISLIFAGCRTAESTVLTKARIGGILTLEIPNGFRQVGDLHDHADFQFENREKDLYLVGISDSRKSISRLIPRFSLKDYSDFVLRNLKSGLEKSWIASSVTKKLDGSPVAIYEIRGEKRESPLPVEMTCTVGIMEKQGQFFQFVAWGPATNSDGVCSLIEDLMASASTLESHNGGSEAQGAEGQNQ